MKKYKDEIDLLKNQGIKSTNDIDIDRLVDIARLYYNEYPQRAIILKKIEEMLDEIKKEYNDYLERCLRKQILKDFIEEADELLKE